MSEVFYFGAIGGPGHYLHSARAGSDFAGAKAAHRLLHRNPWGVAIDAGLCPPGPQVEGQALLHHKNGWTALSFWDRSADHRGGSCSTLLINGTFDFETLMTMAREEWPAVMRRFKFPIVDAASATT